MIQPLVIKNDVIRFQANKIVEDLYEFARDRGFGMNEIAIKACYGEYTQEEQMQFAQLIGYSLSGYSTLSYVTDESLNEADKFVEEKLNT